jgi:uncharacterized protein YmfQ (DUF2313 family)
MLAPLNSAIDYLQQFQRLLPRGRIWHRGWGTVQGQDLLTLMPQIVRLNQRAIDVLAETFPCTTSELLEEWEATLGLPDPCIGELATLQERQAAVCAKFSAQGGQSRAYFVALAQSLGINISVRTFRPFYVSEGRADEHLYDEQWAYVWQINAPIVGTEVWFRVDESTVDEPLLAFGNSTLECLLNQYKPAHTQLIFVYVLNATFWDAEIGESLWDGEASVWD